MGMYDTIGFACPFCGCPIEIQSKAGKCTLRRYGIANVPPAIAGAIHDRTGSCPRCLRRWQVLVQQIIIIQPLIG